MEAERVIAGRSEISTNELASMHKALLYRVLARMVSPFSVTLEFKHVEIISSLLSSENFEVSLPGGLRFVSERGVSYVTDKLSNDENFLIYLNKGENVIKEYSAIFHLTDEKKDKTSLKLDLSFLGNLAPESAKPKKTTYNKNTGTSTKKPVSNISKSELDDWVEETSSDSVDEFEGEEFNFLLE
jgi:hypothetical protein